MTKKELTIFNDMYNEYIVYKDFYFQLSKEYSINSYEHQNALNNCSQMWEKIRLLEDLAFRLGIKVDRCIDKQSEK